MKLSWKPWLIFTFSVLALTLALSIQGRTSASTSQLQAEDKIETFLLEQLQKESEVDFFVWMTEKADLSPAARLTTKEAKGQFVFDTLRETAARTQKDLRAYLDAQGIQYKAFYIANKIYINSGDTALVMTLATRGDVEKITANHPFQLQEPFISENPPDIVESNITFVNGDDVWALGYDGTGFLLAGNDTGLDWDHPALINQYRGWDGTIADHNYNWWDATGTYPTVPNDGHGHGTHTTGTMVGDDGGTNQIGLAPGAETIHCKNMDNGGSGSDVTFTECFEWDLAPWDLSGNNPDPTLAPDAINNSWGYFGGGASQFIDEINALRAAGIVVEVSAGNEGSSCGTLRSPGDYAQSLTTGSVNHVSGNLPGTLTGFSSRGPSSIDPGSFIPDIMAPGENINSSLPGGGYSGPTWSGTSMAGPHVTALVALMWDASPSLEGDVETTEQIMLDTAIPLTGQPGSNCGGDYTSGPNNDWGYGTMDALAAVQEAIVQGVPFGMNVTPESLDVCAPAEAVYEIDVYQNLPGFTDPVTLSAVGHPVGTTASFVPNPVVPPGSSQLTIGNTGAAAPGSYSVDIVGIVLSGTHTSTVTLNVYTVTPGTPTLASPANNATDISTAPTFTWDPVLDATSYGLEIATDPAFNDIVFSTTGITQTTYGLTIALDELHTYYWRVLASNACGDGSTYSETFSFTTRDVPAVLLVDDDDNGPNVRNYYTAALDELGWTYDVWNTDNSDDEPSATDLAPYSAVIWFTGDEVGGAAGPGDTGETALSTWLDNTQGCFFISSQDYLNDREVTELMTGYLGVATITEGNGDYSQVTGQGAVYSSLGTRSLLYPFTDSADWITPDGTAEIGIVGTNGRGAALTKDDGYKTTFWAFPLEAIYGIQNRRNAIDAFITWCGLELPFNGVNLSAEQAQSSPVGTTITYTLTVTNTGNVVDIINLTLSGNVWTTTLSTASLSLDAGETATFTVAVTVPEEALVGDTDTVTVTATSQTDGTATDTATLTTTAEEVEAPIYSIFLPVLIR